MRADADTTIPQSDQVEWRAAVPVLLLMVVGALLRFWSIDTRGLWLDEAVTIMHARSTLADVVATVASGVHPPLFHILMSLWIRVFGSAETAVRSFAAVWGLLSIPAAYWATRVVFDRRSGLIAATIAAFSPYLVWYSQEARMYSMMLFFGFMSVGYLAMAIKTNRTRHWVAYTVFTFLGMFTHYFFVFLVLGEGLYFVAIEVISAHHKLVGENKALFRWPNPRPIFMELPKLKPWLLSVSFLIASYALWLSRSVFMGEQENALVASATGQGLGYGQAAPELALRFNDVGRVVVEMLMGFHTEPFTYAMVAAWPLMISVTLVLFDYMEGLARRSAVVLWSALGLLVISLLGQWQGQVLASRYYIPLAAPVVILAAGVLGAMPTGRRRGVMIAGVALSLVAWFGQSYNPDNALRFEYREALNLISEQYQPGDIVVYEPFYLQPIVAYYLPGDIPSYQFPQHRDEVYIRRGKDELAKDLERVVGPSKRVWLVLSFQDIAVARGDAYNTLNWFERNGYSIEQDVQKNWVRVVLFETGGGWGPIDMMEVAP